MKRTALTLVAVIALAAAGSGWTQTAYPNRPVKLVPPEQLAATIRQETAKWARVVQASGARID